MLKFVVLALVVLVAVPALAEHHEHHECDILTSIKVKSQWTRAYSHGHSREHFAEAIWRALFNLKPEARDALKDLGSEDTSSGKFRAFALFVLARVDMTVTFLNNPDALKAVATRAHDTHVKRHIPDEYVDTFLKALGHVVPAQLGRCWDKEAWKACFKKIADGVKGH